MTGLTATSSGIILEAGNSAISLALYMFGGFLTLDYGTGSAVNASGVILQVDMTKITIPQLCLIEVNVSSSQGAKIAINGAVHASHEISLGSSHIAGNDMGGIGMSYGSGVRANLGGWGSPGQGVLTGGSIVQALVFQFRSIPIASGSFIDFVVTSGGPTMTINQFQTGSGLLATPYVGVKNLPSFLHGVPMTKGINRTLQASFTEGGIHAYGFRYTGWGMGEFGTTVVYSGAHYDSGPGWYNQVVYKYFEPASFTLSTTSFMWFFTRTPLTLGQAALNGP